jgi:hypothetical protein
MCEDKCDGVPICVSSGTVLGAVKAWPGNAEPEVSQARRPALTAPARGALEQAQAGTKERLMARTKELHR